jgi:hypothetical protein
MTSAIPMFYLGPLGRMVALASPDRDIDRNEEFVGQVHTSIDGSTTMDARGYRRQWDMTQAYLDQNDLSYLQVARTGELGLALRFYDPVNKNRLTASTSLCSTLSQYVGGRYNWAPTTGTVTRITGDGPQLSYTALDYRSVAYTPGRYLQWSPAASGLLAAEIQYRSGTTYTDTSAPLFPGETVTLSIYGKRTSGAGNFSVSLIPITGVNTFGTAVTSSTSTSSSWTRLSVSYTVPGSGVIGAAVQVNSSAAGTVAIAQAQLETGSSATGWVRGAGSGEVLIRDIGEVTPIYPLVTCSLSIRER